jgi:diguanylate cyclase (GGDEF)-like protein
MLAAAALLQRARRLRLKMLVALGAATVAPLLFFVVGVSRELGARAEETLRETTLSDLDGVRERIRHARAEVGGLAARIRDTLEFVRPQGAEALSHQLRRAREEASSEGAFLRVPELGTDAPSPVANARLVDAITRPGLYYSPWDGLLAVGVAGTADRYRCLVGLRNAAILGSPPPQDVEAVLFGPSGEALASTRGVPEDLRSARAWAGTRELLRRLGRDAAPAFEARAVLRGEPVALACQRLVDGGRTLGALAVYRSRRGTEEAKAAVLRTSLLSGLTALALVVLAGGTLVDRVTSRLRRLTKAARSLAYGNLRRRVPVESEDEVGRLAASFNRMADALDDRMRQLTELHGGLEELTAALARDEVAQAAARVLARATGARHVVVAAFDHATERILVLHREGDGAPLGTRLPPTGPVRDAVDGRVPVVREGRLVLPLLAGGRTVGVAVCSPVGGGDAADPRFLDATGRQIGIAIENARLYHAAVTDELTGLYTHPFLVRRLREEVDRASATGRSVSLLRILISDYEGFARRQGAAAAARLVAEAAGVLARTLPRRDMVARDGGDLVALLVESDAEDARTRIGEVAAALRAHEFPQPVGEAPPAFLFRGVTYPRDGAAAGILLDALSGEALAPAPPDSGPAPLRVPPALGIVLGRSPGMRAALEVVARVAPTRATVLLRGETGTGKEVLADLCQANSDRRDAPYVKVNCAAIPETLLESELFGHERGAFTGADRRRIGRFEEAHRGTLFLDEIGDLPLPMQAKLLRFLQERRITRVGGGAPLEVDVRIIAASNRDLAEAVRRGEFREDLYHRLHVIELPVPPLRERKDDIPALVDHFRRRLNRRHGLAVASFSPEALDLLRGADWPGNVRELRNAVERAMLLAGTTVVEPRHLSLAGGTAPPGPPPPTVEGLTPRQERILGKARAEGGVTNGEVVTAERVSARTALRELQQLVDRGLLVRVGRRRGAVYKPGDAATGQPS